MDTVDHIRIMNQGDEIRSEDSVLIDEFLVMIRQLEIVKKPRRTDSDGYQYTIGFYCHDTKLFGVTTYGKGREPSINGDRYDVQNQDVTDEIISLIEKQYE